MKTIIYILITLVASLFFMGCSNEKSLQQYFVDSAENGEFISFDVPASILNLADADMTATQKEAYKSIRKLNILALKLDDTNKELYEQEKAKIKGILANDDYQELMRLNSGNANGVVKYLGDDDAIDEVIIYGNDSRYGLALVRVLGKDMKVENVAEFVALLQKSNMDKEGLRQLGSIFSGQ